MLLHRCLALSLLIFCFGAVTPGVSVIRNNKWGSLQGERVGVVSNPTGVLPDSLDHEVDVMFEESVNLVAVFGPEHGFRGAEQAGEGGSFFIDQRTNLPVFSIYQKRGDSLVDIIRNSTATVLVFDIQDVGARFYTFVWTMYDVMEAASELGLRVIVLDRPNPLGGLKAAGPVLHPGYESGVGRLPIAMAHGMTVGELAMMFAGEFLEGKRVRLSVVQLEGWRRQMSYEDTGLPWVMPSPNIPTVDSARAYIGFGLLEGTNLSEGRGTTRPFELVGAPCLINGTLAGVMNALGLPGVVFREAYFVPTFSKFTSVTVGGTQLYVVDHKAFDPILTALSWIVEARKICGADFEWLQNNWIDLLTGSDQLRLDIDDGLTAQEIAQSWEAELSLFEDLRSKYLLY